jgi:hypothetical protein
VLEQEDTMNTITEFSIVAVVIAALSAVAFQINHAQAWPPVAAAQTSAAAVEPVSTGSVGH